MIPDDEWDDVNDVPIDPRKWSEAPSAARKHVFNGVGTSVACPFCGKGEHDPIHDLAFGRQHEVMEGCLDCPHPDYCAGMGKCEIGAAKLAARLQRRGGLRDR